MMRWALTVWQPGADALFAERDGDGVGVEQLASGLIFTEGPVWVPSLAGGPGLLFSDIPADTIYCWRPGGSGPVVWRRPSGCSNGLTVDRRGRLLLCQHARRRLARCLPGWGSYGSEEVVLASHYGGRRLNSPNDVVVRRDGSVYFTDPTYGLEDARRMGLVEDEGQPARRVYRLPAEALAVLPELPDPSVPVPSVEPVAEAVGTQPNGLALSPDEATLYVGDSEEWKVHAFPVAPDGRLGPGRLLYAFDRSFGPGPPDGMRVDADGRLWATGPGGIWVLRADGQPLAHLRTPEVAANVAFGGPDGRSLFVTATTALYRVRTTVGPATGWN